MSLSENESLVDLFPNENWSPNPNFCDMGIFAENFLFDQLDRSFNLSTSPVPISETVDIADQSSTEVPNRRKYWLIEDKNSKRKRAPRLYEFLVLLVKNPDYEDLASFTDREKGLFQIYKPEKVAALWESVKNRQSNSRMTYDKFARAIRWYYKTNLMKKTNTKYTFQFSTQLLNTYFKNEIGDDAIFIKSEPSLIDESFVSFDDFSNLFELS